MATLYNQAESNTRKTFFLIFFFLIFIIFLGWIFSYVFNDIWIMYFAIAFSVVLSITSYWSSDKIILSKVNAKEVQKQDNPLLYNTVENLCITAGLPMPRIYIMPEMQPNAFATGRDEKHAVVVVTQGLLDKLNKRELEGVIAHELSHVKGKDILIGSVVVVLVGIAVFISDMFIRATFWRSLGDNNNNSNPVIMLVGLLAMILAPLAATVIQLAISRKQEFRADANAALLTRDPEGLASALNKISQDSTQLKKIDNATAHLYISDPSRGKTSWLSKLFMTHPPVEDRVKALKEGT
jgi:heat shock protein HtpX